MRDVTPQTLKADLIAGLTGAVIVLPQGVAFAMIAGLPPEYGLYTAIVTPVVAAFFGSSRHLVSGPTTAISIVIFSAVSHHATPGTPEFIELALMMTFLAGVYQLGFGLARLGALVNFVSHTVVIGFTAGAAILIATSQAKHVLGIKLPSGESFLHTWIDIGHHLADINVYVAFVAASTLLSALIVKTFLPRLPYLLIAMIIGALTNLALHGSVHGVTLVGELPAKLPHLAPPDFSLATIRQLAPEAFAIALLGLIEAVSIARSVALKSRQRIDGNQEFIGQGLSNIVGSMFSSYAGSGSFTRSGINYHAGAQTPMSALFAALILAVILLTIAPLTAYLPIAAMGGVILLVAYGLVDWHHIRKILFSSGSEATILIVTFAATLFLELEFAIYAGVLLSLFFYLKRTASPRIIAMAPDTRSPNRQLRGVKRKSLRECPQFRILQIEGSIFFGAVDSIQGRIQAIKEKEPGIKHLLLLGNGINFIDFAGAEMLATESERWRTHGGGLYLCRLKRRPREMLIQSDAVKSIGINRIFIRKKDAIGRILTQLDHSICEQCSVRAFRECANYSKVESMPTLPTAESDKVPQGIKLPSTPDS